MALIQWKQIDSYLSGSKELTGSLHISGTISADEFIGIDASAIFTGSVSASVNPTGNIFVVSSGSENLLTIDEAGNVVVEGSLTAQEFYTEIVSASIIFESGSTLFGNSLDDTHQFTGSLRISGSDGHQISGSLSVQTGNVATTAIKSNNTTVGYPSSNDWKNNLDGSYFNNFDHDTHISEIVRFMAGVMSASLDVADATPNTKIYASVTPTYSLGSTIPKDTLFTGVLGSTYENAKLSGNWYNSSNIDLTLTGSIKSTQEYLIDKGFLLNSETGSGVLDNNVGTNPFSNGYGSRIPSTIVTQATFNTSSFTVSANAGGSSEVFSNSNYFGLGTVTGAAQAATPFYVRVYATQSFSDNYSDSTPSASSTFSSASLLDYSITNFGNSNGLSLAKIITTQPAVIPSLYQDGDFTNVAGTTSERIYTSGSTAANSISASGYYNLHDIKVGLRSGSQAQYVEKTAANSITGFYLYTGDLPTDIVTSAPTASISNTQLTRTGFTATSRSLSGAPYLLTTTYSYTFQGDVNGSFDPGYGYNTTPLVIDRSIDTWANIGAHSLNNRIISTTPSGVQSNISGVLGVVSSNKATQRSVGDIPYIDDICYTTSSYSFSLNSNTNNIQQTRASQQSTTYSLQFRLTGRNWKGTPNVSSSATTLFYDESVFGQSKTTLMGIYSRAQGYDASSLTGTSENFSGEDHRIRVNNNVLAFNGDLFTTNTYDVTNVLGNYDLQVKPGYLVDPGGNYGYWYDVDFGTGVYKYYIRKFRTSGTKTSMTVNLGKTLVNWDATTNGVAATVLFKSSASGSGANNSLTTARLYDPSELNSNSIESTITTDNFKNPFTSNLDLYGNIGGSVSSTTYTIPLRNADGMYLDSNDNEFYIIVRYKGDPSPVTDINITTT
jgi:hypothetical protein